MLSNNKELAYYDYDGNKSAAYNLDGEIMKRLSNYESEFGEYLKNDYSRGLKHTFYWDY